MPLARAFRVHTFVRCATFLAATMLAAVAGAATATYTTDPNNGRLMKVEYDDGTVVDYEYDANGNRTKAIVTLPPDTQPPTAPGGLGATPASSTSINLSWNQSNDNRAVAGYKVERCQGAGCSSFAQIGTTSNTFHSDSGLSSGITYSYRVRAYDTANLDSAYSNTASAATIDTVPPGAPGTPTFSGHTGTSVVANWSAATDNVGVTGYQVSLNGGASWSVGSPGMTLGSLTNGTLYTLHVRARDLAGNWGNPSNASFRTLDTAPPGAPGIPTFNTLTPISATANWSGATDNVGVDSYEYSRNGGSSWTNVGAATTANLTGLTASTPYTVLVRARDAAGNVGSASSGSFTTPSGVDTTPPGVPGTPDITNITGTSARATWSAATDNVLVGRYEYSLNGGSSWTNVGNVLLTDITGLTGPVTYTLQVRAVDTSGNAGPPSSRSFTTLDGVPPGAPGTPTFTGHTGTSVVASWTAATDNVAVTAYQISLTGGASWSDGASSGMTLSGLTNATTYTLHVRARDAAGNWGAPSSASFTTLDTQAPGVPGNPSFSSITGSSAIASWSAASDNVGVTGYQISLTGGASWSDASSGVTLSGLTNATTYTLHVRARDAAGNWGAPSSAPFTTLDTQGPGAPGTPGFTSITGSSAVVSFAAASDNVGVAGYEYILGGGGWNPASSGMTLSGLANATTYSFQVRAYDAAGNRGNLSIGSFTTLDTQAPSAPGTPGFSSVGATSAVVSFSAASDNVGVAGYEYLLNGAGWSVASSGMTLSSLATGVTYTVHVRAYDGVGNRGDPSVNSFTTVDNVPPGAPGAPGFSSIGSTTAAASWGAASDNLGVTSYEYSINGGASWTNVGNTTSATVTGLPAATTTTVHIRARDAAGNAGSPSSNTVTTIAQVTIATRTVSNLVPGFNGSQAVYSLRNTGDIFVSGPNSNSQTDGGDWLLPKAGMGGYEVMATHVPGPVTCGGVLNSWQNLSAANHISWGIGRGGPSGTTSCTFDIQIRHTGSPSVILGTARITLSASN